MDQDIIGKNNISEKIEQNKKRFVLDKMVEEIRQDNLCIFAGAGLSVKSGYLNWKDLLQPLAESIGLDTNMDLTLLAQYYEDLYTREDLNQNIIKAFEKKASINENMQILADMPISRYWTTNYDTVIEDTLVRTGKVVDVVIDQAQFKYHNRERDAIVYKMHGDKSFPDEVVLTKTDYENYDTNREIFTHGLIMDLTCHTFLFIGFSFSDPNLDRIIAILKRNFHEKSLKRHYCFLKKIKETDYSDANKSGDKKAKKDIYNTYIKDYMLQQCKIADLNKYGIEVILVNDYQEITEILRYMNQCYKLNSVFISGAFKNSTTKDECIKCIDSPGDFIMKLTRELLANKYHIITGFGEGVGNYIVAGAYSENRMIKKITNRDIEIRPLISFSVSNDQEGMQKNREELIERCGIFLCMFGSTKKESGSYIEYNIALEKKKIIIPLKNTGGLAEKVDIYDSEITKLKYENVNQYVHDIIVCIEKKKKQKEERLIWNFYKSIKEEKPRSIFISYNYDDSRKEFEGLSNYINAFSDFVVHEEKYYEEKNEISTWISTAIAEADYIILVLSDNYFNSDWCGFELNKIQATKKNVIIWIKNKANEGKNDEELLDKLKTSRYSISTEYVIYGENQKDTYKKITRKLNEIS